MSCCASHSEPCSTHDLFSHTSATKSQVEEVRRVHDVVQAYLKASVDEAGSEQERAALLSLEVSPPYPSKGLKPFQSVITSITALYWSTTTLSLTPEKRYQLATRLTDIPAFEDRVPQFSGQEVDGGEDLSDKKLEAIMRVGAYILPEISDKETIEMWRELAEVSAGVWEI
ncbi:hypothetical protein P7C70_g8008, partial [Phenoliferia sp. Uapishka_3]